MTTSINNNRGFSFPFGQNGLSETASMAIGVTAATALLAGTVVLLSQCLRKKEEDPHAKLDQFTKKTLEDLHIREFSLPTRSNLCRRSEPLASNEPKPIFDSATTKQIRVVQETLRQGANHNSPIPNLVFSGPPGVGKTMLAEHLCQESGLGWMRIPSAALETRIKTGNHIDAVQRVIRLVEERVAKCDGCKVAIIIDEGENVVSERSQANEKPEVNATQASWFNQEKSMSTILKERKDALLGTILEETSKPDRQIGFWITTNRPWRIDRAFLTRCRVIEIKPPNEEERKNIIITHLPTIFNHNQHIISFFHAGRLESLAKATEGFTGRSIVKMLEDLAASVKLENNHITQELVDASLIAMKASLDPNLYASKTLLGKIKRFAQEVFA